MFGVSITYNIIRLLETTNVTSSSSPGPLGLPKMGLI